MLTIATIERRNSSVYGNPRFLIAFTDGTSALTMSDASFCYAIGNPGMRAGSTVSVEFTRAERIRHITPSNGGN